VNLRDKYDGCVLFSLMSRICGSYVRFEPHGGEHEDYCLLGSDVCLAERYQRFWRKLLLPLSGLRVFAMTLEAATVSKAFVRFLQIVWLYMSVDSNFHLHDVCLGLEILWILMCKISAAVIMAADYVHWLSLMMDFEIGEGRNKKKRHTHVHICQSIKNMIIRRTRCTLPSTSCEFNINSDCNVYLSGLVLYE
jgi:hypothetical protein